VAGAARGILSIQSKVAYGHVGNSAAVFPLQRLGFEVWPVDTVHLSNHKAYPTCYGRSASAEEILALVQGIGERGAFARCRAVLSGYLGEVAHGEAVLGALARVRAARPDALYLCDPVMGDDARGLYVRPGIPELLRERALPLADIVTPNRFELGRLTDRPVGDLDSARAAAAHLRDQGPRIVVVTSLEPPGRPGEIAVLADTAESAWLVRTPRLDLEVHGGGDVFAALLLGHHLRCRDFATALTRAVSAMHALVEATFQAGMEELMLVESQDCFLAPPRLFAAERLR
jgi:pyridoxine kinase